MRNSAYIIAIILTMVICFSNTDNYTMRYCEVVKVENKIVTIEDNKGDCWEWELEADEDIKVGQRCRLKMSDNYTDYDRTDDYIREIVWEK